MRNRSTKGLLVLLSVACSVPLIVLVPSYQHARVLDTVTDLTASMSFLFLFSPHN